MKKRVAVVPAKGIGDALMMLVASHNLSLLGHDVTNYTQHLHELDAWFPDQSFASPPKEWKKEMKEYDLVVIQGDQAPEKKDLLTLSNTAVFYPYYILNKCPPLRSCDYVFSQQKTMVENIAEAIALIASIPQPTRSNGITPPQGLVHRKEKKRVVIHPMSSDADRIYAASRFMKTARMLKKQGYLPVFAVSTQERLEWEKIAGDEFDLPAFPTLAELAAFVYESGFFVGNESGTSHLASCLGILTLVVAGNKKRIDMWRPGWLLGKVTTPPKWVLNVKGARLRTHKWQYFISPHKVVREFRELADKT